MFHTVLLWTSLGDGPPLVLTCRRVALGNILAAVPDPMSLRVSSHSLMASLISGRTDFTLTVVRGPEGLTVDLSSNTLAMSFTYSTPVISTKSAGFVSSTT